MACEKLGIVVDGYRALTEDGKVLARGTNRGELVKTKLRWSWDRADAHLKLKNR